MCREGSDASHDAEAGLTEVLRTWECDVPVGMKLIAAAMGLLREEHQFAQPHMEAICNLPSADVLKVSARHHAFPVCVHLAYQKWCQWHLTGCRRCLSVSLVLT